MNPRLKALAIKIYTGVLRFESKGVCPVMSRFLPDVRIAKLDSITPVIRLTSFDGRMLRLKAGVAPLGKGQCRLPYEGFK